MSRLMQGVSSLVCVGIAVTAMARVACADFVTENFDTDPGWVGNNNTGYGANSYGFSNTNNAGGTAGEVGGAVMSRTADTFTWYADNTLGAGNTSRTLGSSDAMQASGRFVVPDSTSLDGGFEIGFINTENPVKIAAGEGLGGMVQAVAMRLVDEGGGKYRAGVRFGTNENGDKFSLNDGTQYLFNTLYTPNGGGAGVGQIDLEIRKASDNSLVGTSTTIGAMDPGLALNAFGICTLNFAADKPAIPFYMDNLSYGTVPEPGTITLLSMGMIGLFAYAWRRR